MRRDAVRQDLLPRRVECRLAPGADRNGGTGSRECKRNRPPDAAAAPGDDGALTLQADLHQFPLLKPPETLPPRFYCLSASASVAKISPGKWQSTTAGAASQCERRQGKDELNAGQCWHDLPFALTGVNVLQGQDVRAASRKIPRGA